ncbi:MAG: GTPase [Planctomycetota bacterium]
MLTPPGSGAIAVVGISGDADLLLRRGLLDATRLSPNEIGLRDFAGEDVVVVRTAAETFEAHCHGGVAAVGRLRAALTRGGLREVDPWEFADVGFDRIWRRALAGASTASVAGALIAQRVAWSDFFTRLIEAPAGEAVGRIDAVFARSAEGRSLVSRARVVLCGRPNVGKSSLLNALAGFGRAIVSDRPGTTRDVVEVEAAFGGRPVTLCDTAGLRTSGDVVEAEGVRRTQTAVDEADLRLVVLDRSRAVTETDEEVFERAASAGPSIVVFNKIDLPGDSTGPAIFRSRAEIYEVSAITGEALQDLAAAVGRSCGIGDRPAEAVPFAAELESFLADLRVLVGSGEDPRGQINRFFPAADGVAAQPGRSG